ncbi:hypothetical protein AYI70_g7066 [Smittium culicis]|uniref:Retrotransposon gag domain-containing protein n=2 Tax=Smittium culicis TaxID=133412 RepID=A0A1R1XM96_9FUNG|nr:hypothetical protein AYI70_g7066 [Smittium culicis]
MSDNSIQLTASQITNAEELLASKDNEISSLRQQLIDGENSFNALAEEHNKLAAALSEKDAELAQLKLSLDTESRHRLEQAVAYEQLKAETAMKCEQLAVKEASLYKQIMELQNNAGTNISAVGQASLKNIPKIPSFDGQPISFNRWIFGVDELFTNYPGLSDFQKLILVVDSLKGEARSWYDAEPDGNIDNWDNLRQSLAKQFGGAESLSMALDKIYTMRLTEKSDFNSFIQQVRPAIKIVTGDNSKLAIVMLRKQIDQSIRKYLPEIANETFEEFEKRLKAQITEIQSKPARMNVDRHLSMEIDPIVASIKPDQNITISAAQYTPQYNNRYVPVTTRFGTQNFRNPFQRNTKPHSRDNITMTKVQFDERNTVRKQRKPPDKPQSENSKLQIQYENKYDIKNDNKYDIKNDNESEYDSEIINDYDDNDLKYDYEDNDDNDNYDTDYDFTTFSTNISSLCFNDEVFPPMLRYNTDILYQCFYLWCIISNRT